MNQLIFVLIDFSLYQQLKFYFSVKKNVAAFLTNLILLHTNVGNLFPFWRKGVDNDTFHLFLSDAGLLCLSGGSFLWT